MSTNLTIRNLYFAISSTLLCLIITQQVAAFRKEEPDVHKDVAGLIQSKGYPVERYTVQTSDGYLLGTYRIPYGRATGNSEKTPGRPVALIMTSFITDSSEWVLNFPEQSLGFILADSGYDVWLGCTRGCTYSQRNVNIPTDSRRFWDFSWEETGTLDLPALVDFVLSKTNQEKLLLLGHSMGTTVSLVFLSLRPEYNSKVKAFLAMAPVANLSLTNSFLRFVVPVRKILYPILEKINNGGTFSLRVVNVVTSWICSLRIVRASACNILVFFGDGVESPYQYNATRLPVYLSHIPGGGSAKQFYHYGQVSAAGQFVRFDYGRKENVRRYGQKEPPQYPVEKITVPVALFWSLEDQLAEPQDVSGLRDRLANVIEFYKVPSSPFTHLDFITGINAYQSVYQKLISVMDQYRGE